MGVSTRQSKGVLFAALFQKQDIAHPSTAPATDETPDMGEEPSAGDVALLFACPITIAPLDLFKVKKLGPRSPPKSSTKVSSLQADAWGGMLLAGSEDEVFPFLALEDIPDMQLGPMASCAEHNTPATWDTVTWEETPTHDLVDSLCEESHLLHTSRSESHPGMPICWSVPSDSALAWVGVGLVCFIALATLFLFSSLPVLGLIFVAIVPQVDCLVDADSCSAVVIEEAKCQADSDCRLLWF